MNNFITTTWHDKECFVLCTCEAEGIHLFLDNCSVVGEPLTGLVYFTSYNKKYKKDFYYEFLNLENFIKFKNSLIFNSEDAQIFLVNNSSYTIHCEWYKDTFCMSIFKIKGYTRDGSLKIKNKPLIQITLSKNEASKLMEELDKWGIKN